MKRRKHLKNCMRFTVALREAVKGAEFSPTPIEQMRMPYHRQRDTLIAERTGLKKTARDRDRPERFVDEKGYLTRFASRKGLPSRVSPEA
jgi:hypothetical protein